MNDDRTMYRRVRLLTGGAMPVLLAGALLAFARLHDGAWEPAAQAAGICRELIAGTTEGRQALVGSCWVAPLPTLAYLPFAWLLPEPWAGSAAFFAAWVFAFWAVREAVKAAGHSGWRIGLAQLAVAAAVMTARQPQVLQLAAPLAVGLSLLTAAALADWMVLRRLRDAVAVGGAAAMLLLCGVQFFAPALLTAVLVPLAVLGDRDSRPRFSAWLLLAGLPVVYTLGVWLLLNRLVLGDALYFLRSLGVLAPDALRFVGAWALPGLLFLPVLILIWLLDARRASAGVRPVAGTAALIAFALTVASGALMLARFGMGWDMTLANVCVLAVLLVSVARMRQPVYRTALVLAVFVGLGAKKWLAPLPGAGPETASAQVCREVEEYVDARSPYGRVFALGYAGLELLRDYRGERLVPNLDVHIGTLRRAYKGQNLYLLVPRPVGKARAESVFWKHPDIYWLGGDRLLFAGAFGSWHLFEVVTAPTQEQLDEWRKAK